jgi:mannose-6-phosphate isomerase-like protein (cupin superfamily)
LSQKVYQLLNDITPVVTAHGKGEKFIFLTKQDAQTKVTQFAYGKLLPGENCAGHFHPTMEEFFYFINGEGEYTIDGVVYNIQPNTFFRIPVNTLHALRATGAQPLTFVYFGIAT